MRIAILEDDEPQQRLLSSWLADAGHEAHLFATGKAMRETLRREAFDLLILDWNVPDCAGIDVLRWAREHLDWAIPVLFTTVRNDETDLISALKAGADDYLCKPLKRGETLARIEAVMRRVLPEMQADKCLHFAPYTFDLQNRQVSLDDAEIRLTNTEFQLALALFRNQGRLLSRNYLMETIWGISSDIPTRRVDTYISRLRNKLDIRPNRGWCLSAVYHHGYRLELVSDNH
ncbi:MAG: response regulator transcription factor [Gammaproteobacteria bacterium]|nr:response regulator transcription factor [Gammaproteobacteria bacterium]